MTSSPFPSPLEAAEYAAVRGAIRQRGTARMLLVPAAFAAWGAIAIATASVITVALGTLVPLLVLAAAFEGVFALHLNVERLGRYLQVFHEADAGWEHVVKAFGDRFPNAGTDPLFVRLFIFGASVNFFPAALGGELWEVLIVGACHFGFIYRVRRAQTIAASLRADDLRRFQALRSPLSTQSPEPGPSPATERPID